MREMPGYGQRVQLHVDANTRNERGENINESSVISKLRFVYIFFCLFTYLGGIGKRLKIKAQFLINGQTDDSLTFIDDDVRIPHFDDCEYAREENNIGKIALGCIITVIGKTYYNALKIKTYRSSIM